MTFTTERTCWLVFLVETTDGGPIAPYRSVARATLQYGLLLRDWPPRLLRCEWHPVTAKPPLEHMWTQPQKLSNTLHTATAKNTSRMEMWSSQPLTPACYMTPQRGRQGRACSVKEHTTLLCPNTHPLMKHQHRALHSFTLDMHAHTQPLTLTQQQCQLLFTSQRRAAEAKNY